MPTKRSVTVLYDAAEDTEKVQARKEHRACPLTYVQVAAALKRRGYSVRTVAAQRKISSVVSLIEKDDSDVIFNLCEALAKSSVYEHNVVGLLELYGKCFTGTGSAGYMLAGDKALCKKIFQFHDIRYPSFCTCAKGNVEWSDELDFPLIVKPLREDASMGIDNGSVVHNVKELLERISYIHGEFDGGTLVEEFIEGREIYVGVLGNDDPQALPIIEWDLSKIKDGPQIAGAEAKWDRNSPAYDGQRFFPEDIPEEVVRGIQEAAITAYKALKLSGYARVDMRLRRNPTKKTRAVAEGSSGKNGKKKPVPPKPSEAESAKQSKAATTTETDEQRTGWDYFIIEVNPNCWLERRDEFATAAHKMGLSYPSLLERIIELAHERRAVMP